MPRLTTITLRAALGAGVTSAPAQSAPPRRAPALAVDSDLAPRLAFITWPGEPRGEVCGGIESFVAEPGIIVVIGLVPRGSLAMRGAVHRRGSGVVLDLFTPRSGGMLNAARGGCIAWRAVIQCLPKARLSLSVRMSGDPKDPLVTALVHHDVVDAATPTANAAAPPRSP